MALSDSRNITPYIDCVELLRYFCERDNLSLDGVVNEMRQKERMRIIENHPYNIFQSKDGRFRTYVRDTSTANGRRMIAKSSREKLIDALVDYYDSSSSINNFKNTVTLSMLYPDWIHYKSLHVEKTTIDRVHKDWKRYYENTSIVNKPIRHITKLDLDEWIHKQIKQFNMDKHQYGNFSLILRQELQYAVDREIIDENPFSYVRVDKKRMLRQEHKKSDESQVFSLQELDLITECAMNDMNSENRKKHKLVPLAVLFLFQTGVRLGELSALRFEDIIDDTEIIIRRTVQYPRGDILDSTKGTYGDRVVPLTPKAVLLIRNAEKILKEHGITPNGYIFSMTNEPILTYLAVQKTFAKYCDNLGITRKSPHKARKTYISELLDHGVNINTVRSIAGHKDEQTTLNNYCYDMNSKEQRHSLVVSAIH